MPHRSKAQSQLIEAIEAVNARNLDGDRYRRALRRLFEDRNVSCDVVKIWGDADFEAASPTGYPAQPTGATEGDRIIDAIGADDMQTELAYLRRRLDTITQRMTREREGSYATHEATRHERDPSTGKRREVTTFRPAKQNDVDDVLKRLGFDDDGSPPDAA